MLSFLYSWSTRPPNPTPCGRYCRNNYTCVRRRGKENGGSSRATGVLLPLSACAAFAGECEQVVRLYLTSAPARRA